MINEIVFLFTAFIAGSIFTGASSLGKFSIPALGFIIGCALQIIIGTILAFTGKPVSPILNILLVLGFSIAWLFYKKKTTFLKDIRLSKILLYIALPFSIITIFTIYFFNEGWARYSGDSWGILRTLQDIAQNGALYISPLDITTRLFGSILLHLPATVAGEFYMRAVLPLLGISIIFALMWFVYIGCGRALQAKKTILLVIMAGLLLLSNNSFIFHSLYIHTHLICAAMALLITGCGWLMVRDKPENRNGYLAIIVIAIPAFILTRTESVMIASMAIIPMIAVKDVISIKQKRIILLSFGLSTLLCYGYIIIAYGSRLYTDPDMLGMGGLTPIAYSIFGLIIICLALFLRQLCKLKIVNILMSKAVVIVECFLWISLLILYIVIPGIIVDNLRSIYRNFVLGLGAWGWSVIVLTVMVLLVLIYVRIPKSFSILRFPVTTFMPIMLITAPLAGGYHRPGPGGSLNRMFIQIVPLVILFIVMSIALGEFRFVKRKDPNEDITI